MMQTIRAFAILMGLAAVVLALTVCAGCQTGSIQYDNVRTGEHVKVTQPPKAIAPATGRRIPATQPGEDAGWEFGTGETQTRDFADENRTQTLVWAGIAMMILAVIGVVARAYLPVIPLSACLVVGALGLALVMLPTLNPAIFWGGLALAGIVIGLGWWDNHHKLSSAGQTWTGASILDKAAATVANESAKLGATT